jgi:hypothetical protein
VRATVNGYKAINLGNINEKNGNYAIHVFVYNEELTKSIKNHNCSNICTNFP